MFIRSFTKIPHFILSLQKHNCNWQFLILIGWNFKTFLLRNYKYKWFETLCKCCFSSFLKKKKIPRHYIMISQKKKKDCLKIVLKSYTYPLADRIGVVTVVSKSGNPSPGPVPKSRAQIRIFFITSLLRH